MHFYCIKFHLVFNEYVKLKFKEKFPIGSPCKKSVRRKVNVAIMGHLRLIEYYCTQKAHGYLTSGPKTHLSLLCSVKKVTAKQNLMMRTCKVSQCCQCAYLEAAYIIL